MKKSTNYKSTQSNESGIKKGIKKVSKKDIFKSVKRIKKVANFIKAKRRSMIKNSDISVSDAKYLHNLTLEVVFNNGVKREVDFSLFFDDNKISYLDKYKSVNNFKKFKIEEGNVVWGKDWDLIFPVKQLYSGKIKS